MATPRFRRVNIDGKSLYKTETRLIGAAPLLPGTFARITNGLFVNAAAATGRLYLLDPATSQGLDIMDPIPVGNSAVGNYVESGREFAVRFAGGSTLIKDDPISVTAAGLGVVNIAEDAVIVGYSQESIQLPAGAQDFVRVRMV